jgi:hypothetical protein
MIGQPLVTPIYRPLAFGFLASMNCVITGLNNMFTSEGIHYFDHGLHDIHLFWKMGTGSNPLGLNKLCAHVY